MIPLGLKLESILAFETLVLISAIFHHSNLRLPPALEKALSFVVVTPSIHWVHHHAVRADTDSNYSTVLSLWDRLFASRSRTPRTPTMPIGVEGRREENLGGLLMLPFKER
jgi:sterol desaturase/sphingolipid hydroxylase (fatty acid hydroxylase superfamily)